MTKMTQMTQEFKSLKKRRRAFCSELIAWQGGVVQSGSGSLTGPRK